MTDCYCPHSFILPSAEGRTELLEWMIFSVLKIQRVANCTCSPEGQLHPALHQKRGGQQGGGGGLSLSPCEAPSGVQITSGASRTRKMWKMGPEETTNMIRGLESISPAKEGWGCELKLFSLEKRRLQGDIIAAFQYIKGAYKKDEKGLCQGV